MKHYNVMVIPRVATEQPYRLNMVNYRNLENAKRRADAQRGGFVIERGNATPIYVGAWR